MAGLPNSRHIKTLNKKTFKKNKETSAYMYRTAFNSKQCCEVFKNKVHCVVCVCACVRLNTLGWIQRQREYFNTRTFTIRINWCFLNQECSVCVFVCKHLTDSRLTQLNSSFIHKKDKDPTTTQRKPPQSYHHKRFVTMGRKNTLLTSRN